MGRRRSHFNRGKKREDGGVCKEPWRRSDASTVSKNNRDHTVKTQWDSAPFDWYGKEDVPAVTHWDDSGVREAWESAVTGKALSPNLATMFSPDLYNDTNIDWDRRTSCSIAESAEEGNSIEERAGASTNVYEHTRCSEMNSGLPRPQSPVILGLLELHKEKGYQGWECPPDAEIVPTGWVMPDEAVGEGGVGWDVSAQLPQEGWGSSMQPQYLEQVGAGGWEQPSQLTQHEQPSWPPSSGTHPDWGGPTMQQSAGHTTSAHLIEEAEGSRVVTPAGGHMNGWDNLEKSTQMVPDPANWTIQQQVASGWGQEAVENRGPPTYGWEDYPCYTSEAFHAAQEGGTNWWMGAGSRDSWHGQDRGWGQSSHAAIQESQQDLKPARNCLYGHQRSGHTSKQWHPKQDWNTAQPFTQATKLY